MAIFILRRFGVMILTALVLTFIVFLLTNLYWRQGLADGRLVFVGGWVDATDYLDIYGLISPWTHFSNFAFSTGSATIPAPNQGLGLAAGYDKSGHALGALAALGFGFLEIGSVSADPSAGNPKPRLWRLPVDQAICVHYGLPNEGAEVISRRLVRKRLPVPSSIKSRRPRRNGYSPISSFCPAPYL